LGQPVVGLDDRASMDARMLTYTSPALESDLQITGFPTVRLEMASTHTDGAVLVYLEDVAPDGRSRYLTEGGLRLLHRKVDPDPGFEAFGPVHSFATKDALPMVPGETATIDIRLNPVSVKIARGHRIRLAIAGADAAIFRRVPESGNPTLTIERNSDRASFLQLPVLVTGRGI
jgi:putative CocE/NonD family hydrolase